MDYEKILKAKRQEVWGDLEALRLERGRLDDSLSTKEAQLRNLDELIALESGEPSRPAIDGSRQGPTHFLDVAAELLGQSQDGVHYQDLLSMLNQNGINVPGRDPGANLIAHLSRDARFVRTGRGTYGLENRHAPVATPTRRVRTRTYGKRRRS